MSGKIGFLSVRPDSISLAPELLVAKNEGAGGRAAVERGMSINPTG